MTREGIIWRDYIPTPRERAIAWNHKQPQGVKPGNLFAHRFMQPKPKGHPHPEADGCANFAREYERAEMLDGRFPDFGD